MCIRDSPRHQRPTTCDRPHRVLPNMSSHFLLQTQAVIIEEPGEGVKVTPTLPSLSLDRRTRATGTAPEGERFDPPPIAPPRRAASPGAPGSCGRVLSRPSCPPGPSPCAEGSEGRGLQATEEVPGSATRSAG